MDSYIELFLVINYKLEYSQQKKKDDLSNHPCKTFFFPHLFPILGLKVWTQIENNNLTTFFFINFNYSILPNMGKKNQSFIFCLLSFGEPSYWRPFVNNWDFKAELSSYDSRITILLVPSRVKWLTRFSLLQVVLFLVLSPHQKEWGNKCLTSIASELKICVNYDKKDIIVNLCQL